MILLFVAFHLIMVHGPGGQYFEINVDMISSIRVPRAADTHFPKRTRCLLTMTNGNLNAVQETCEKVNQLIKEAVQ